jgi:hypothetical protein
MHPVYCTILLFGGLNAGTGSMDICFKNRYKFILCQVADPPLEERHAFAGVGSLYSSELGIEREQVWMYRKHTLTAKARSYWAVRKLGFSATKLSKMKLPVRKMVI